MNKNIKKLIIIILTISIIISNMYIGVFVKAVMPDELVEIKENVDTDLSLIPNICEIEEKRTENSKTYLKENGMYETVYYKGQIHYKTIDKYKEIDNTLKLKNNKYSNTNNGYTIRIKVLI